MKKKMWKVFLSLAGCATITIPLVLTSCSSASEESSSQNQQDNNTNKKVIKISESNEKYRMIENLGTDNRRTPLTYVFGPEDNFTNPIRDSKGVPYSAYAFAKDNKESSKIEWAFIDWSDTRYFFSIPSWFLAFLSQSSVYSTYLQDFKLEVSYRHSFINNVDQALAIFRYILFKRTDNIKVLFNISTDDWASISDKVSLEFKYNGVDDFSNHYIGDNKIVNITAILESNDENIVFSSASGSSNRFETKFQFPLYTDEHGNVVKDASLLIEPSKINVNATEFFKEYMFKGWNELGIWDTKYPWEGRINDQLKYVPKTYEEFKKVVYDNHKPGYGIDDFLLEHARTAKEDGFKITKPSWAKEVWWTEGIKDIKDNSSVSVKLKPTKQLLKDLLGYDIFEESLNAKLGVLDTEAIVNSIDIWIDWHDDTGIAIRNRGGSNHYHLDVAPFSRIMLNGYSKDADYISSIMKFEELIPYHIYSKWTFDKKYFSAELKKEKFYSPDFAPTVYFKYDI